MSSPVRVVLADDHRIVREGIRDRLAAESDIEVVGEAANGREALDLVRRQRPDVVVLDVEMPEMTGVEVARAIRDEGLEARVLVLSGYDDAEYVGALLDAGAAGYLTKDERLARPTCCGSSPEAAPTRRPRANSSARSTPSASTSRTCMPSWTSATVLRRRPGRGARVWWKRSAFGTNDRRAPEARYGEA